MAKILVTGATGFLGKHLCLFLLKEGHEVRGTYRTSYPQDLMFQKVEWFKIPNLIPTDIWDKPIEGCDILIHSAARVHQMRTTKQDEEEFYRDNIIGTKAIADAALRNKNVKQFIYISSLLVYGKSQKMPLNQNKECLPDTTYGKSKLMAENILRNLFENTTIMWTFFRPAIIYGENNKGNIASLEKFIKKGLPLPVKGLKNKRSFLSVQNMCKYINVTILNENARNKIFNVADPEAISTEEFVIKLGTSLNLKPKIIWVPFFMQYIMAVIGQFIQKLGIQIPWNKDILAKISGDFSVDMKEVIKELKIEDLFKNSS